MAIRGPRLEFAVGAFLLLALASLLVLALASLLAAIDPMLKSKPALPAHIEAAIFQKGRNRIEIETNRNVEDVYAEFGSRGFDMPSVYRTGKAVLVGTAVLTVLTWIIGIIAW